MPKYYDVDGNPLSEHTDMNGNSLQMPDLPKPPNPIPQIQQGTTVGRMVKPILTGVGGSLGSAAGGAAGTLLAPGVGTIPGGIVGGVAGGAAGNRFGETLQDRFPSIFGSPSGGGINEDVSQGLQNEAFGKAFETIPGAINAIRGGATGIRDALIRKVFPNYQTPEIKQALQTALPPEMEAATAPGRTYGQETANPLAKRFESVMAAPEVAKTVESQRQAVKEFFAPQESAQASPISIDALRSVTDKMKPGQRAISTPIALQRIYQVGVDPATRTFDPARIVNEMHDNKALYDSAIGSQTRTNVNYLMDRLQAQYPEGQKSGWADMFTMIRKGHLAISIPSAMISLAEGHTGLAQGLLEGSAVLFTLENFAKAMANPASARAIIQGTKQPALLQSNKILTRTILNSLGRGAQVLLQTPNGEEKTGTIQDGKILVQ